MTTNKQQQEEARKRNAFVLERILAASRAKWQDLTARRARRVHRRGWP